MDGQIMYRAQWLDRADTVGGLSFFVTTGTRQTIGGLEFIRSGEVLIAANDRWHATKAAAEAEIVEQCVKLAARLMEQAETLRKGGAA